MTQKGLAPILIVLILAALVGGYLVFQNQPKPISFTQPTIQPFPTSDPTSHWKTYTNTLMRIEFKYPNQYQYRVVEESKDKLLVATDRLGSNGFWISTDRDESFIDYKSLETCEVVSQQIQKNPRIRPSCLDSGKKFGQNQDIVNITLGENTATSFYITSTGRGGTSHIIQTINEPKIQIYIFFPNQASSITINQILSTFKFLP